MNNTEKAAASVAPNKLLVGPIVPTLAKFALPNVVAMMATALAAIAETTYVGKLGVASLAGMALAFPFVMLQGMFSNGAMGSGVSSAVSRALGAGRIDRANALAVHALWIGLAAALVYMTLMLVLGPTLFAALGGRAEALSQAIEYSNIAFLGSFGVWLLNTFASVIRGSGNMLVPSSVTFLVSILQLVMGGVLCFGLGPIPGYGMGGVAAGQVFAYTFGALGLYVYLRSKHSRIRLHIRDTHFDPALAKDILRVGALACISPLQNVLTIIILTWLVAKFGTNALAAYGIGNRLEFLLIPIAFAMGSASVPMVGMAIGSGNVPRARKVAWSAAGMSFITMSLLGLLFALVPTLWTHQFTSEVAVLEMAATYFHWVGPAYGLFGLGLCLYFSSLGAGRAGAPVLVGSLRMLIVVLGGWWLVTHNTPEWTVFALAAFAMLVYGVAMVLAIRAARWEPVATST